VKIINWAKRNLLVFIVFSLEMKEPAGLLTWGYLLTAPSHQ